MTYKHTFLGQAIINGNEGELLRIQKRLESRKLPPTPEQINDLKLLLKQFDYKKKDIYIPQFATVAEMELWQRKKIKEKLGC